MTPPPDWLPPLLSIDGEWDQVLSRLYDVFTRDWKQAGRSLDGLRIWWDRRILRGDLYEEAFWHLITKTDKIAAARLLDSRRAERLPWCRAVLEHAEDQSVRKWTYREGSGFLRTYVWLEEWDYVVILEKRRRKIGGSETDLYFLVTAFYVEGDSKRRDLRRKYTKREP